MGLSCQTSGTENTEKKKKIKQFLFHCNMMKNLLNLSWDGVGGWWNCQTLSGLERIDAVNIKFQLHPLPSSTGAGARLSPAHPASPQFSTWEVSVSGDRGRKHWSLKYVMHPFILTLYLYTVAMINRLFIWRAQLFLPPVLILRLSWSEVVSCVSLQFTDPLTPPWPLVIIHITLSSPVCPNSYIACQIKATS